jgi:transposase
VPRPAAAGPDAQKKTVAAAERDEAARAAWRAEAAALAPADLIFFDETSTHTAMTRARARAPRGERARGAVPRNHGPTVTLLAALTPDGMGPALLIPGATTRPVFDGFVAEFLVPTLRPGQTVVLDNLSVHKSEHARALVEAAGCRLLFLPPYSPDFNPIELLFSPIKGRLRAAAARTADGLLAAVGAALAAVTPDHARACYAHCGYHLPDQ